LLFLLLWKVPKWQVANIPDEKDRLATESGFRQTLVQLVGGAALLGGLYFTAQTLRTTQDGQITDRFTKAIGQIGDKELAVRLGGIYALERIANDSPKDHWQIMEVLTAYVRDNASWPPNNPQPLKDEQILKGKRRKEDPQKDPQNDPLLAIARLTV